MAWLDELRGRTQEVEAAVGPAVVAVGRRGCGVVVDEGFVLTNAHNAAADEVTVAFAGGRGAEARVAGTDPDADLAVLAVATGGADPPPWSDDEAAIGHPVFALARTGPGALRVTFGTVSATDQRFRGPGGRRIAGGIEHTAPLARGSSGGPIVDPTGRLLGLNTNRLGDGFYLALPVTAELRARVEALKGGATPRRRRLGIGAAPAVVARRLRESVGLPPRDGVLVRAVADDSPAARADLRVGDLIVAAGGRAVASVDDLHDALETVGDGDDESLRIGLVRGTEERETAVFFERGGEQGA